MNVNQLKPARGKPMVRVKQPAGNASKPHVKHVAHTDVFFFLSAKTSQALPTLLSRFGSVLITDPGTEAMFE